MRYGTDAWAKYVMMSNLMYQVYGVRRRFDCPRATGRIGKSGALNLARDGDCVEHINHDRCKRWDPQGSESLPPCLFSNALTAIGIRHRAA
jgi:hypothetical protein